MKKTIRGSNSGFTRDGVVHSTGQEACPRITLLRAHSIEPSVEDIRTQKTFNIGFLNEELFVKHYMKNIHHSADYEISDPVTADISFEGHADVVTDKVVFELKSVTSKNTWSEVKKGNPKWSNVAQLLNYMLSCRVQIGYLVYSLYAYVDGIDLPDIFFLVKIDDEGEILLNGKPTGWSLDNIVADRKLKSAVLENNEVYPIRPVGLNKKSPCCYCPFKSVCDSYEGQKKIDTEEFLNKAKGVCDAIETEKSVSRQKIASRAKEVFGS